MAMAARALCLFLLIACAQGQWYDFCKTGIPEANFSENEGVDVILAVAPLFSTNPRIGGTLGMLGFYHTALVFAQGNESNRHYWTLEFDYTQGSIVNGAVPKINGSQLSWDNDARYCLTDGLLWGRKHWAKEFDHIATLTQAQAQRVFNELVYPVNSTARGEFPQYQLWRVVRVPTLQPRGASFVGARRAQVLKMSTLLGDLTCADGINWVLNFIVNVLGVPARRGFQYRGSSVWVNAHRVERVNTSDPEVWKDLLRHYKLQVHLVSNSSAIDKLFTLPGLFPMKYVYDSNSKSYFRLHGNTAPFVHFEYAPAQLLAPPLPHAPNAVQPVSMHLRGSSSATS